MIIPEINRNYRSAHSHPPPDDNFRANFSTEYPRQNLKKPRRPIGKSYDEEVENIPETVKFIPRVTTKFDQVYFGIVKIFYQKDPKTFDEVNIQGPWALTSDGKQFLLHQEPK